MEMLEQRVPVEAKALKDLPDKQVKKESLDPRDTKELPDQLVLMVKLEPKET
jgi:hypothetical protein